MLNSFASIEISQKVKSLVESFPKFFSNKSHKPEKEHSELLNEFVILNARRPQHDAPTFNQGYNKPTEMIEEESDPAWDTGSEEDFTLESKQIDNELKQKVDEKLGEVISIRKDNLKRHEQDFLEDYIRNKRKMEEENSVGE